jgi:hypothetical protein
MTLLAACASEKLALAPPAGVDFSGTWKLKKRVRAHGDTPRVTVTVWLSPLLENAFSL